MIWNENNLFWSHNCTLITYWYSKASRYTASRSTDLGDTRFLIGSQNTWDTRFLAKSLEDARFFLEIHVFDQKPWRCTVFSFDVLDSSLVKEFTSFMLILRQISNFFTVTKGFKVWFIFNLILLCASKHILYNKKKQINHFHLCQLYVFNLPASS